MTTPTPPKRKRGRPPGVPFASHHSVANPKTKTVNGRRVVVNTAGACVDEYVVAIPGWTKRQW